MNIVFINIFTNIALNQILESNERWSSWFNDFSMHNKKNFI